MRRNKRSVVVKSRDPEVVERDPKPSGGKPVPAVFVPQVLCPHCKSPGPWRQGGTTHANLETKQMQRWRVCLACNRSHVQVTPMTKRQIELYGDPNR